MPYLYSTLFHNIHTFKSDLHLKQFEIHVQTQKPKRKGR